MTKPCAKCGGDANGRARCPKCAELHAAEARERRLRLKAAGVCNTCGKPSGGKTRCDRCYARHKGYERARFERLGTEEIASRRRVYRNRAVAKMAAADPGSEDRYMLKNRYGITWDEFKAMFAAQGGRCAVCGALDPGHGKKRLAVDHDHATGRVRGLLCHSCNVAIGHMGDEPETLESAAAYLRRSKVAQSGGERDTVVCRTPHPAPAHTQAAVP